MKRAASLYCFGIIITGCVNLNAASGVIGRINIKFCENATKKEKDAFFYQHNLKPIAYNIFGYDVAEWRDNPPKILKSPFPDIKYCLSQSKTAATQLLVREYEIEMNRLTKPISRKRSAPKKQESSPAVEKIVPWLEQAIKAEEAHKFLKSKHIPLWTNGIVIADNGFNFGHPDIKSALKYDADGNPIFWANPKRKLSDFSGTHGTSVACLAAGYRDGKGIDGIAAKNTYILPIFLKFDANDGSFASDLAIGLMHYKILETKGIVSFNVVNMSFRMGNSAIVRATIEYLKDKLFVAAAGNIGYDGKSRNIDEEKLYPASWNLPNIIAVAATDRNDEFAAQTSYYGPKRIDIAAPGEYVETCDGGGYTVYSGTSFSAAFVSGTLSLLFSIDPFMDAEAAKYALLLGAVAKGNLMDKVRGGRRLNVYASARLVYDLNYGFYVE